MFFLLGYMAFIAGGISMIIIGAVSIGIANGVGVPYLNTIAGIKGGKNATTTVMPLLSAALYLGQFISPLVVLPAANSIFGESDITGPYKVGCGICVVFLLQVWLTRHFQSLPPAENCS